MTCEVCIPDNVVDNVVEEEVGGDATNNELTNVPIELMKGTVDEF